ncbi:hypothetical protein M501DRAFT_679615 [Patellaria atrata CBS 101060]|uniref:Uncharacterized protein n=1 Tax=Patellaria atrata CBS 101060 TaxID=1346257 RepID=A0A9P4SCI2_9PEZI|nr:hypothetical protein M501DRAFT_679615 [Patellaria atrata CBS 101060]
MNVPKAPRPAPAAYPPPPRRAASTAQSKPDFGSTPSSGANRFAQFPKPPPPPRQSAKDDAEARRNNFTAWEQMHKKKTGAPPPPPPPPPQQQDTYTPHYRQSWQGAQPMDQDDLFEKGKSAWEAWNSAKPGVGRSNTTKTPKKTGFDPNSTGDERQATSTSNYHTTHRFSQPPPPPPRMQTEIPMPPPRAPTAKRPDPLGNFRARTDADFHFVEGDPKLRTPYGMTGGEKTYFNSEGLKRSTSTKDAPNRSESVERNAYRKHTPQPANRHRSVSPPRARPYSDGHPSTPAGANTANTRSKTTEKHKSQRRFFVYSDSSDSETECGKPETFTKPHAPTPPIFDPQSRAFQKEPQAANEHRNYTEPLNRPKAQPGTSWTAPKGNPTSPNGLGQRSSSNIFTVPLDRSQFPNVVRPGFKSKSEESINTKFSPNEWSGKFQGTPDYFAVPKPPSRPASQSRGRPPLNVKPPGGQTYDGPQDNTPSSATNATQMPPPPRPTAAKEPAGPSPNEVKFSKDEWEKTFSGATLFFPPPKASSPVRPPPVRRGSKTTKPRIPPSAKATSKVPKKASVSDVVDEEDSGSGISSSATTGASTDSEAMDIDLEPPAKATTVPTTATEQRREPRMMPIPPMRPEWRESARVTNNSTPVHGIGATRPPPPPPPQQPTSTIPPGFGKLRDSGGVKLEDLTKVSPFAQTTTGLEGLDTLSQNLPFTSQPATTAPLRPTQPQPLKLPLLPAAPEPPARLTQSAWTSYNQRMNMYMFEWHKFNEAINKHFAARQAEEGLLLGTNWLEAVGDDSHGRGFESYCKGLKEDERVREHWNTGLERHALAMEKHRVVRARVGRVGLVRE